MENTNKINEKIKKRTAEFFESRGCKVLSIYKDKRIKIKYICTCGEMCIKTLGNFKRQPRCNNCGIAKFPKRHTYEYVNKYFEDNNCVLLEKEYNNAQTKMKFKCSCGRIGYKKFYVFKLFPRCSRCSKKRIADSIRLKFKQLLSLWEQKNESRIYRTILR